MLADGEVARRRHEAPHELLRGLLDAPLLQHPHPSHERPREPARDVVRHALHGDPAQMLRVALGEPQADGPAVAAGVQVHRAEPQLAQHVRGALGEEVDAVLGGQEVRVPKPGRSTVTTVPSAPSHRSCRTHEYRVWSGAAEHEQRLRDGVVPPDDPGGVRVPLPRERALLDFRGRPASRRLGGDVDRGSDRRHKELPGGTRSPKLPLVHGSRAPCPLRHTKVGGASPEGGRGAAHRFPAPGGGGSAAHRYASEGGAGLPVSARRRGTEAGSARAAASRSALGAEPRSPPGGGPPVPPGRWCRVPFRAGPGSGRGRGTPATPPSVRLPAVRLPAVRLLADRPPDRAAGHRTGNATSHTGSSGPAASQSAK